MELLKELLDILACPKCKGNLSLQKAFLTCGKCGLAYPVIGSVPNMLVEEAWSLEKAKKSGFKHELKL